MIDEMLGQLFGEAVFGKLGNSRRAQLLIRVFLGLLGTTLGIIGAFHFALRTGFTANGALRVSIIMVFVFLAGFSLFNIGLGRKWRWPGVLFVLSFLAVFVTRILFGA
jgi:hypothetical protein